MDSTDDRATAERLRRRVTTGTGSLDENNKLKLEAARKRIISKNKISITKQRNSFSVELIDDDAKPEPLYLPKLENFTREELISKISESEKKRTELELRLSEEIRLREEFSEKFSAECKVTEELISQATEESQKRVLLEIRLAEKLREFPSENVREIPSEELEQQLAEEIILKEEIQLKYEELSHQFSELSVKYDEILRERMGEEREITRKALETLKLQLEENNLVIHEKDVHERNEKKIAELSGKLRKTEERITAFISDEKNSEIKKILDENTELSGKLEWAERECRRLREEGEMKETVTRMTEKLSEAEWELKSLKSEERNSEISELMESRRKLRSELSEKDVKIQSLIKEKEEFKKSRAKVEEAIHRLNGELQEDLEVAESELRRARTREASLEAEVAESRTGQEKAELENRILLAEDRYSAMKELLETIRNLEKEISERDGKIQILTEQFDQEKKLRTRLEEAYLVEKTKKKKFTSVFMQLKEKYTLLKELHESVLAQGGILRNFPVPGNSIRDSKFSSETDISLQGVGEGSDLPSQEKPVVSPSQDQLHPPAPSRGVPGAYNGAGRPRGHSIGTSAGQEPASQAGVRPRAMTGGNLAHQLPRQSGSLGMTYTGYHPQRPRMNPGRGQPVMTGRGVTPNPYVIGPMLGHMPGYVPGHIPGPVPPYIPYVRGPAHIPGHGPNHMPGHGPVHLPVPYPGIVHGPGRGKQGPLSPRHQGPPGQPHIHMMPGHPGQGRGMAQVSSGTARGQTALRPPGGQGVLETAGRHIDVEEKQQMEKGDQ